jgi:hypothetical protein
MFAKVQIGSSSEENKIVLPIKAIMTDQSRKFVYVADNGVATYREIKLGDTVGNTEQIVLSGLNVGDKVVIDGLMKLRPGAKIDPKTPEEIEQMKAAMAAQAQQGAAAPTAEAPKEDAAKENAPADAAKADDQKPAQE